MYSIISIFNYFIYLLYFIYIIYILSRLLYIKIICNRIYKFKISYILHLENNKFIKTKRPYYKNNICKKMRF